MTRYRFPARVRLRKEKDIQQIFRAGSFRPLGPVQVKFVTNPQTESRFLITVSKKVGSAPERNRIKRLLREAIRLLRPQLQGHYDICFFIKQRPQSPLALPYLKRKVRTLFAELSERAQAHSPAGD